VAYGLRENGRLPNAAHESHPWRIREIVPDFTLEDVWALPAEGGADDFPALLEVGTSFDPANSDSRATRALWQLRDRLGGWFGLGRIRVAGEDPEPSLDELAIPGTGEASLLGRLPEDLRDTSAGIDFDSLPFSFLYRTDTEFAAELSNRTVHAVMHLAWVEQGKGRYKGQMAVYVKPRGAFGTAYMALIKPFRYLIVYPALMRQLERAWSGRVRA
jgi:Protein of unknown function (DUF2867)